MAANSTSGEVKFQKGRSRPMKAAVASPSPGRAAPGPSRPSATPPPHPRTTQVQFLLRAYDH